MSEAGCRPLLFSPESIAHPSEKCNSFSINRHFFVTNRASLPRSGKISAPSAFSAKKRRRFAPARSSPQSQHVRRCVPRGLTARLASPLPTHLLRICAILLPQSHQRRSPRDETAPSEREPRKGRRRDEEWREAPAITPSVTVSAFSEHRDSSLKKEPTIWITPSAPSGHLPSYIGLPQRFCEAKDLWEEEQRASEQSRK